MTREETKQLLPIFKAYSEGKTIQFRDSANNWHDFEQETVLIFDGDVNDYRVKPSEVENEVKINKELRASLVFLMTKLDSVKSESKLLKDDNLVNSLSEVLRYFKRNGELKEAYKEIYKDMLKENNEFVTLFFKFLTKDNDADLNESIKKFMTDEEIDKIINRTIRRMMMSNIIDTDLFLVKDVPWGNIKLQDNSSLILGSYEDGQIKRQLFSMNKKQVEQLVEYLNQIKNIMK